MARIEFLIFGYRRLSVSPQDVSEVCAIFIRHAIVSRIDYDGSILVRECDTKKIKEILSGRIDFILSEPLGLYGRYINTRHKAAIISGLIIGMVVVILLSTPIWDVRVSGNENYTDEEILSSLENCGLYVGRSWLFTDRSAIEHKLISTDERISWVSINRRGSVAYVRVIERAANGGSNVGQPSGPTNLVSSADCVIEEITVRQGTAVVSVGDTVKKGDLLVVGIMPDAVGGGACAADATVIGRCADSITVELERIYDKKTYVGHKLYSIELNFFNFSLNIFKLYGNLTEKYDIIEHEIEYTHLDKVKFPFSVRVKYIPLFEISTDEYTDTQLIDLAVDRLNMLTTDYLASSDLLRIRTEGSFTDKGYSISSRLVFLTDVAVSIDFVAE